MHEESTDEFNSGNGVFFPLAFFTVVLYIVGNSIFIHANDTMITDSNSMCIFPKVIDNGLGTIEGFLAVGNPVFFVTDIQQFFESIMVTIFFTATMKLKLVFFP